ncbi:MAG: redoxin domain-containing protein [Acidobacteriota bacterium]|nr:redoxin domain-containing protein [Acidobacteriota bacterium]
MSLKQKLHEISERSGGKIPDEIRHKMARATQELKDSGQAERAIGVGDKMPSFALPNTKGETIKSDDLLKNGNLVVTFYRGVW